MNERFEINEDELITETNLHVNSKCLPKSFSNTALTEQLNLLLSNVLLFFFLLQIIKF